MSHNIISNKEQPIEEEKKIDLKELWRLPYQEQKALFDRFKNKRKDEYKMNH